MFVALGILNGMMMVFEGLPFSLKTEYSTLAVALRCNTAAAFGSVAAAFGSVAAADFHYIARSNLFSC